MKQPIVHQQALDQVLADVLDAVKAQNILVVTGKRSFESSGAKQKCEEVFREKSVQYFTEFSPNPTIKEVKNGLAAFEESEADTVLAIGGGSAMDIAKSIAWLAGSDVDLLRYVTGERSKSRDGVALIAVPTTAGTGSEVTHFAVVYVDNKKYSLAHPSILPDYVVLDAELTYSLPASITATSGLDALSQAIESYWSINSTEESRSYSREAIPIIVENLQPAVTGDVVARARMLYAAHLAGKAINIAKTTAAHALSYPLTSHFGVPHGHAVMLTLPQILVYNSAVSDTDCADSRGVAFVQKILSEVCDLLGFSSSLEASTYLHSLIRDVGLVDRLGDLHVEAKDVELLVSGISPERMGNNPCRLSCRDIHKIYASIL
jgi:alcohol dehydrogenase class IV